MTNTFRAAYFVTADGQSDICLTSEDQAHLTDDELIEAAVAEAHNAGLIAESDEDAAHDEDAPHFVTEAELRDGLHIGEYTR